MYDVHDITPVTTYFPLRASGLSFKRLAMRSLFGRMVYLGLTTTRTAARLLLSNPSSTVRAPFVEPTLLQNN